MLLQSISSSLALPIPLILLCAAIAQASPICSDSSCSPLLSKRQSDQDSSGYHFTWPAALWALVIVALFAVVLLLMVRRRRRLIRQIQERQRRRSMQENGEVVPGDGAARCRVYNIDGSVLHPALPSMAMMRGPSIIPVQLRSPDPCYVRPPRDEDLPAYTPKLDQHDNNSMPQMTEQSDTLQTLPVVQNPQAPAIVPSEPSPAAPGGHT